MTSHKVVTTFTNGTSVVHEFPTERFTLDQVRAYVVIGTTVPSVTQQDVTLSDGRTTSWKRGHGWSEVASPAPHEPKHLASSKDSEEYESLETREDKQAWFDANYLRLRNGKHVAWTGQDNPYGKRVHYVKLDAVSSLWSDTLLIDYCDGGPHNFGGKVQRSPGNGEAIVTIFID